MPPALRAGRKEARKIMMDRKSMSQLRNGDRLKDEVYRQMFRLEENRPGADLELVIALLRGWIAPCSEPGRAKLHEWLNTVCPICLQMIEAAREGRNSPDRCIG